LLKARSDELVDVEGWGFNVADGRGEVDTAMLTCPMFLRILPEFAAAGRTPVSLDPGFGLEGVQDRHWCTL
jgi:hypothetical protein